MSTGAVATAEIYDPATGDFASLNASCHPSSQCLTTPRSGHTATLLPNGKVLIAGGEDASTTPVTLSTTEVYNATSQTFSPGPAPLQVARFEHTATLLPNEKILMAGGDTAGTAELYDFAGASSAATGSLNSARSGQVATVLPDGLTLIAGGNVSGAVNTVELYDSSTGTFTAIAATTNTARANASATLLNDGTVIVVGGVDATPTALATAEAYTPSYDPQGTPIIASNNGDGSLTVGGGDALVSCTLILTGTGATTCNTGSVTPRHVNGGSHIITPAYLPDWSTNTSYQLNALILPALNNVAGFSFAATVAGTSSATLGGEPNPWPQAAGSSILDPLSTGPLQWTNAGLPNHTTATLASSALTLTVTKLATTLTAHTETKSYDGTRNSSVSAIASALLPGDATVQSFEAKDVLGTNGSTLSAVSVLNGSTDVSADYSITSISAPGTITAKAITERGLTVPVSKVYDGTKVAAVSGTATLALPEAPGAGSTGDGVPYNVDNVSITGTATGSYDSKDVPSASKVTFGDVSLLGSGFGNYTLTIQAPQSAAITAKVLPESGLTATATKPYDGTTTALLSGTATLGSAETAAFGTGNDGRPYANDDVHFAGTAAANYDFKDAAAATTINFAGLTLAGAQAADYTLQIQSGVPGNITPVTVTASITGTPTKTYDGTTNATLTSSNYVLAGLVGTEKFTVTKTTGTLTIRNAGVPNNVSVNLAAADFTPSNGAVATNYNLPTSATGTASITPLTLTATAVTDTKVYNGNTASTATVKLSSSLGTDLSALGNGDTASFSQSFDNRNVGTGHVMTATGSVTDGNGGNNYTLRFSTVSTGVISAELLTITAATSAKPYDGTTIAASGSTPSITNGALQAGDTANFTEAYTDKNAGSGKTLMPSGAANDGNSGNNYSYSFQPSTTGVINPLGVTVTATTNTKQYDATTSAAAIPTASALAPGDSATFTEAYDNKNVSGTHVLTAAGVVTDGNNGNNYTYTFQTGSGTITPAPLTVTAQAAGRVYDGTATASATVSDVPLANDQVTAAFTAANFTDKNAGTGKTVNVTGISISGTDAGNYTFNSTANASATILPAPLTVTADPQSHIFGSGLPNLTASPSGFVAGETLATSGVSGAASCSTGATMLSPVGSYPITCTNGNLAANNYAFASFAPGALTVGPATTNSVVVSPQSTKNSATFTFIATVAPQFAGVPGGTVTFMDNGTALASSIPLDANGQASFNTTVNELAAGQTHTITAVYNKDDPNFAAATTQVGASIAIGAALSTTPGAPIPAQTLQLASSGGASVTYSGLSCGVLDAFGNTVKNTICTGTPAGSFTLPATVTLTIATSNGNSTTAFSAAPQDVQRVHALESLWLAMPAMVLLPLAIPAETRRRLRQKKALFVIGLLLVLCVVLVSVGCGGGNGFSNPNNQQPGTVGTAATPNGSYVVQITATNQQGQSVAVGSIPLTVAAN
ncbi:MAG TPA: YDG domain-containing protein [Terriglobales bacterium]|nr:YDG domain-containing protein [Terriglobales bacterium]